MPSECATQPSEATAPAAIQASLDAAASAAAFADLDLSISVWIEGWGEVLAVNPDLALTPASNQKLLVAYAALEALGPDRRRADVANALRNSDNQVADSLLRTVGRELAGDATLASGITAMDRLLNDLVQASCVSLEGVSDDGSGLSRANMRSAREFQELLRAMQSTEAGRSVEELLPVGGVSGTLARRFSGDVGRVAAKTGTLRNTRALSGYAVTDSGRNAVFSIIVNGDRDRVSASLPAIDGVVTAILRT